MLWIVLKTIDNEGIVKIPLLSWSFKEEEKKFIFEVWTQCRYCIILLLFYAIGLRKFILNVIASIQLMIRLCASKATFLHLKWWITNADIAEGKDITMNVIDKE